MAVFRAEKGFHFSEDGVRPWAHFKRVAGSDPVAYEFETDDSKVIDRLSKVDGVTRVDEPKRGRKAQASDESAE